MMTDDEAAVEPERPPHVGEVHEEAQTWRSSESDRMKKIRQKRKTGVPDPKVAYRGNLAGRK